MNKSNFDEKPFYDARDVFFSLNCVGALTVFLLLKLPLRKLES